jgi:hypothetical protein
VIPGDCRFNYQRLFLKLSDALTSKYRFDFELLGILRACLCRREALLPSENLPGTIMTFGQAISNGYLYNEIDKRAIPFVTPLFLYNYLKHMNGTACTIGKILISCETSKEEESNFGGDPFEVFHLCWESLIRCLWPSEFITLQELYNLSIENFNRKPFTTLLNVGKKYPPYRSPEDFSDFLKTGKGFFVNNYCVNNT